MSIANISKNKKYIQKCIDVLVPQWERYPEHIPEASIFLRSFARIKDKISKLSVGEKDLKDCSDQEIFDDVSLISLVVFEIGGLHYLVRFITEGRIEGQEDPNLQPVFDLLYATRITIDQLYLELELSPHSTLDQQDLANAVINQVQEVIQQSEPQPDPKDIN